MSAENAKWNFYFFLMAVQIGLKIEFKLGQLCIKNTLYGVENLASSILLGLRTYKEFI